MYEFSDVKFELSQGTVAALAGGRVAAAELARDGAERRVNDGLEKVGVLLKELGIQMNPQSFMKLRKALGSSGTAIGSFITEGELPGTVVEYNKLPNKVVAEKGNLLDDACNVVSAAEGVYTAEKTAAETWDRFKRAALVQAGPFRLNIQQLDSLRY